MVLNLYCFTTPVILEDNVVQVYLTYIIFISVGRSSNQQPCEPQYKAVNYPATLARLNIFCSEVISLYLLCTLGTAERGTREYT